MLWKNYNWQLTSSLHADSKIICRSHIHMEDSARGSLSTMGAIKIDRVRGEKAESFGGSSEPRKLSPIANGVCGELLFPPPGIRPRWIKSLLISREAHSPIPEPSSFRLLGSSLYSLSIRLPTSFAPASSHSLAPSQSRPASLSPTVSLVRFSPFSLNFLRCFPRRTRN